MGTIKKMARVLEMFFVVYFYTVKKQAKCSDANNFLPVIATNVTIISPHAQSNGVHSGILYDITPFVLFVIKNKHFFLIFNREYTHNHRTSDPRTFVII